VQSGVVSIAELDEGVRHVLRMKFALGLFDHPYVDEGKEATAMLRPEYLQTARTAAEQSFVLLKNEPGPGGKPLLPLSHDIHRIAVIGPLTEDPATMLGAWAGLGQGEDVASLRSGLVQLLGKENVFQAKGSEFRDGTDQEMAEGIAVANKADAVILTLGEHPFEMSGEAASRSHLDLPGRQQELLEKVVATGKPVVLLLFSGRPLTVPWAFAHVPAVLASWFPGIQAGPALVRTLFGESNPSGKLVVSWPRSVGQVPIYYDALNTGRPADKVDLTKPPGDGDDKFVSRYIDELNSPQFPFGYGLSYTSFGYGPTEISANELHASILEAALKSGRTPVALTVSASVTNTGRIAGDEVVQLYVRLQGTSVAQPVRALKGFQRISLAPGETRKVTFSLDPESFALWNDHNLLAVEPSHVTVWVSPNSASGTAATLEITDSKNAKSRD
jgi:beta-glucosidase